MLLIRRALPLLCVLLVAGIPSTASADKKECSQAHVDAQKSMKASTLRRARDQLKVCSRDECIAPIRKDCVAWLDEVTAGIPSVVVEAKGPDGKETFDVKVSASGEVLAEKLDVHAIDLDPGTYTFTFEREGSAPIQKEVILRQGQKNKVIEISFAAQTSSNGAAAAPPAKGADKEEPRPKSVSILPWAIGGAGVVLAGVGGAFWLSSESTRSDLEGACSPNCDQGEVDGIKTQRLVGDVFFVAGLVAIGTAVVLIVIDQGTPKGGKPPATWTAALGQRGFAF